MPQEQPTKLERAREAVAAYHEYRGYPGDAVVIRQGRADYSTDVQCALVVLLMTEDGLKPPQAAIKAFFTPSEEQSQSKPLCEKGN